MEIKLNNAPNPATGAAKVDALLRDGIVTREDLYDWERADMARFAREYRADEQRESRR